MSDKSTRIDLTINEVTEDGDKTILKPGTGELEITGVETPITKGSTITVELSEEDQKKLADGARVTANLIEVVEAASEEVEVRSKEG